MTVRYHGAPLEQSCIRPGHWRIEGYDVHRVRDGGETYWEIRRFGQHVETAVSLGDARAWIGQQVHS